MEKRATTGLDTATGSSGPVLRSSGSRVAGSKVHASHEEHPHGMSAKCDGLVAVSVTSAVSVALYAADVFYVADLAREVGNVLVNSELNEKVLISIAAASGAIVCCWRNGSLDWLLKLMYSVNIQHALRVALSISAFMFVGPCLIILNKHIMQDLKFNYPLSLSGLGLLTSAVAGHGLILSGLATLNPESQKAVQGSAWYRTALPIGLAKAGGLATGNAVYLHLGVGFIQMGKALTPAIVVLLLKVFDMAQPTRVAVWSVCLMIIGTLLEVKGEMHPSFIGIAFILASDFLEALQLVLSQRLLQNCKLSVIECLHVLAPPGAASLFAAAAVLEWRRMFDAGHQWLVLEHKWYFLAACGMGLLVNFLGLVVVQVTSSLTVKILNTVRGIGLVAFGMLFYGEQCSAMELIGYGIALVGFFAYNWAQLSPEGATRVENTVDQWLFQPLTALISGIMSSEPPPKDTCKKCECD